MTVQGSRKGVGERIEAGKTIKRPCKDEAEDAKSI